MTSWEPPSYKEATKDKSDMLNDWSPPIEISDRTNVCNHCGVAAVSGNYCAYCGQLIVHTTQPMSVIHLPQISTITAKITPSP